MTQPSCPRCNGGGRVMKLVCDDPAYCPVVECPDCGGTGADREAPGGCPRCAEMLAALEAVRSQGSHGTLDDGTSVSFLVEEAIRKAKGGLTCRES